MLCIFKKTLTGHQDKDDLRKQEVEFFASAPGSLQRDLQFFPGLSAIFGRNTREEL